MKHAWILDVLSDLSAFARANELEASARHLDQVRQVAAAEIAMRAEGTAGLADEETGAIERGPARLGGHGRL